MFKADQCDLCGDCLVKCQWIKAEKVQAVEWMKDMMAGQQTPVLHQCITCYACNEICPQKANPFDLIARLQEEYRIFVSEETVKAAEAKYAFTKPLTNYPKGERVMTTCLFGKTHTHLMQGELYDLPRVDGKPYFCWLLFSHWGVESVQRKHAQDMVDRLALTGAREIICFHDDCYAMLATLAPEYGIEVPFRPVHLSEYLVTYLRQNRHRIKPLNIDIAYQRPCASRHTPEKEHFVDELFELVGARRVLRAYDRENAMCCAGVKLLLGLGDPRPDQEMNIGDAKRSGAQALVCLCPVCISSLSSVASEHGMPLVFLGDIVRMALGEISLPPLG
jgi:Fe-S oxidoreductase